MTTDKISSKYLHCQKVVNLNMVYIFSVIILFGLT